MMQKKRFSREEVELETNILHEEYALNFDKKSELSMLFLLHAANPMRNEYLGGNKHTFDPNRLPHQLNAIMPRRYSLKNMVAVVNCNIPLAQLKPLIERFVVNEEAPTVEDWP